MKRILLGTLICVALIGCEYPETGLTFNEVYQRDVVCHAAGGEQVFTMGTKNPKLALSSRCKLNGLEFNFYYSKYVRGPQL